MFRLEDLLYEAFYNYKKSIAPIFSTCAVSKTGVL